MEDFSAKDLSTIGGIATVSLLHSFIPTHWLPFSIVARAQKWTLSRTVLVNLIRRSLIHLHPTTEEREKERSTVAPRGGGKQTRLEHWMETMAEAHQETRYECENYYRDVIEGEERWRGVAWQREGAQMVADRERRMRAAFGAVLHVVSTSLLGLTAITMANTIAGEETVHKLASLLLVVLGASYVMLHFLGKGGHNHSHKHPMEKMAVVGLVLVPALSPCATTLPVFLAVGNSPSMMVLAIIVLLFSTITVMTSLVALSFYGASQIKFHWVERNDKLLVGSVLVVVGILTWVFHDHDGDEHLAGEHLHRKIIVL